MQRDRTVLLRYADKTQKLLGLIYRVRNELKAGWSEEIYHQALFRLCECEGIPIISKPRSVLEHRGIEVHTFEPDMIVWDLIILELKALAYQTQFTGEQYAQLIHYLKYHGKDLGLLINFAPKRVQTKRIIWDEPVLDIDENYARILPLLADHDRPPLRQIRECILTIGRQYGLGYSESVYRKLLFVEAANCGINCIEEVEIPVLWQGERIAQQRTQHILMENRFLLHLRSLLDYPTEYDFTRLKTYLAGLQLPFGLVINFGRTQLQIYGVSAK